MCNVKLEVNERVIIICYYKFIKCYRKITC